MKNSRFKLQLNNLMKLMEYTLFYEVFIWIMKSEDGKEWEKVAIVLVHLPMIAEDIVVSLDFGDWRGAVEIVADVLSYKFGLPPYRTEKGRVHDIWKRSRLIRVFDRYPERLNWRVSPFAKQLEKYNLPKLSERELKIVEVVRKLGCENLPVLYV